MVLRLYVPGDMASVALGGWPSLDAWLHSEPYGISQ